MPLRYPAFPRTFERAMEAHFAGFLLTHKNAASPLGPYEILEGHEAYGRWIARAVIDPETGRPADPREVPQLPGEFVYCYAHSFDPPPGEPERCVCRIRVGAVTSAHAAKGLQIHDSVGSLLRGIVSTAPSACRILQDAINSPAAGTPGHPHRYARLEGVERAEPSENEFGAAGTFGTSWVFSETWILSGYLDADFAG